MTPMLNSTPLKDFNNRVYIIAPTREIYLETMRKFRLSIRRCSHVHDKNGIAGRGKYCYLLSDNYMETKDINYILNHIKYYKARAYGI